jgi:hypothetical protein
MAITIPACELVGLFTDTLPFALPEADFPAMHCIRIAWDGEMLHAQAHDGQHLAWSRWAPDDDPDDDAQESFLEPWGADDEPWETVISLPHAQEIAKTFKPGKKQLWVPLTLAFLKGDRLRVTRDRIPGSTAIDLTVERVQGITFANFEDIVSRANQVEATRDIAFTAAHLAHFADVRPRGPMTIMFTADHGPALVTIGKRFTGAIQPVRIAAERRLQVAA